MTLCRTGRPTVSCALGVTLGVVFFALPVRAQTIADTPQGANMRIKEMADAAAKTGPHDYIIGNGDLVDVDVFDVKELSREARVSQTGTIGLPLVPVRLHVAGLTEAQAEQKIAEVLEANGLVTNPAVSVTVKEHKSKPITIVGAVNHPEVYQSDHQVTLLEVLAEAGGIANDAGDSVIITRQASAQFTDVTEPPAIGPEVAISSAAPAIPGSQPSTSEPPNIDGQKSPAGSPMAGSAGGAASSSSPAHSNNNTITVNLNDLVETGDATNNIQLQSGDIVTVPHAGIVYVLGAVGKPGGYILSNDRTEVSTLKILALAGGLTPTAKSDHALIIRKNEQGQQHDIVVDLKSVLRRQTEDVQLLPSDILYVPDSHAKAALLKAAELGVAIGTGVALYRIAYR